MKSMGGKIGIVTLMILMIAVVPGSAYFVDRTYTATVGIYDDAALTVPVADGQDFSYSVYRQVKVIELRDGVWTEASASETLVDSFTASQAVPYSGIVSVSYWGGTPVETERPVVFEGESWWFEGQDLVGGISVRTIYRYVIRDDAVPAGYSAASPDGVILTVDAWAAPALNYQKAAAAAPAYTGGARSYNQRGATTLGDGVEYQVLDLVCGFTQSLTVSIEYPNGILNDVTYAYEHGDSVEQYIRYGSNQQNLVLNNPTGKIHVQALKWSGDDNNAKEIRLKVTDWMGSVVYEESTSENLLDVYLTLSGCSAEEFAAWMAARSAE